MKAKSYTMKVHARRVLQILNRKNPCGDCPLMLGFVFHNMNKICEETDSYYGCGRYYHPCLICRSFSGLETSHGCPCRILGKQESVKRAWIKLEEMGLI